jgi:hypothetical protein
MATWATKLPRVIDASGLRSSRTGHQNTTVPNGSVIAMEKDLVQAGVSESLLPPAGTWSDSRHSRDF